MSEFQALFSPIKIGSKTAKNRIFMSPMGEGMANPDGSAGERFKAYYLERAKGGVGVLTIGYLNVDYPLGSGSPQVRIDDDTNIQTLTELTEACHSYGSLVIAQIHHAGGQSTAAATGGKEPWTPSNIDCDHIMVKGMRMAGPQHAMTTEEVEYVRDKFITAAVNVKRTGADGVTIHGGHGYLISEFLTRDFNARDDKYGGSVENRARLLTEIIAGIRKECGDDFIIGARIPGKEFVERGLTEEECVTIAKLCEEAGADFLDVTVGSIQAFSQFIETEKYPQGARVPYAKPIKEAVSIPVGVSGTLRDPEFCESLIEDGKVDFICLARALLCDPYWPKKAEEGHADQIRKCLSCSEGCMRQVMDGGFVSCVLNPVTGRENEYADPQPAEVSKKVAVIGGGIAGLEAAIVARTRGHEVVLLEKTNELGGQLNLACLPPDKGRIREAADWFSAEAERKGVDIRLNTEATVDLIREINPDVVLLASGGEPVTRLPIEGNENALQVSDVMGGTVPMPRDSHVAVVGGGLVACELTEMLIENGNRITMIEMKPEIAEDFEMMHRFDLLGEFAAAGVDQRVNATVRAIGRDSVTFEQDGENVTIPVDTTIMAVGRKSFGAELGEALREAGYEVKTIGDARKVSKILNATLDAYEAVYSI